MPLGMPDVNVTPADDDPEASQQAEPPEAPAEPPAESTEDPDSKLTDPQPVKSRRQVGRRSKEKGEASAIETFRAELAKEREAQTKTVDGIRAELSREREERARLAGALDQMRRSPAPQTQVPSKPSPDELYEKARAALDKNDYRGYEDYQRQAVRREIEMANEAQLTPVMKRLEALAQQRAQPASPAMNPTVQAVLVQHPAIAMAGDRGMKMWVAQDQVLEASGVPPSRERALQAAKQAETILSGATSSGRGYSQSTAPALAASPAQVQSGSGAGGGEIRVPLSEQERRVAHAAGMDLEEYRALMAEADPGRIVK